MQKSVLEILLDEACAEPVTLTESDGTEKVFEQIALIPLDGKPYAILAEKALVDAGELECAGRVFFCDEEKGMATEVLDEALISEVFEIYDRIYEEEKA